MNRIMVATDFSTRSDRALRRAALLARRHGATLEVVHAIDDDQPRAIVAAEERAAAGLLADLAATLKRVDAVACAARVVFGPASSAIVAAAAAAASDLLVLGPHRRQTLRDVFIGTTAERTIRASACPVLMANAPPVADYRHALLATDLSEGSARAIHGFLALGLTAPATPTIVHVFDTMTLRMAAANPLPQDERQRHLEQSRAAATAALAAFVAALDAGPMSQQVCYQDAPVADVALRAARAADADLVVVGTRGRSGLGKLVLGSVAEAILRTADRDVLAVPPDATG
ncbi:MAG: universal stress protein [Gammaproteobacteria bacterium]